MILRQLSSPENSNSVYTIHILKTGEVITSVQDYMKFEDRFSWVDKKFIVERILHARQRTDEEKKSVIVIYEDGQVIKEYINIDNSFTPLTYY
ncbi:MAG: hypothetical protein JST87_18075 [Bacteroidetes bacterium]|nr:hypothetical protein [Bacteroidota bacterium]MBS1932693.1 hypothetical protein [Bacteroidota bacterium]